MNDTDLQLKRLQEKYFSTIEQLQALLFIFNLDSKVAAEENGIMVECPECGKFSVFIRVIDSSSPIYRWTAYCCRSNKISYNNIIGLIRLKFPKLNPTTILNEIYTITRQDMIGQLLKKRKK